MKSVSLVLTCWAATSTFPILPINLPPNEIGTGFPDWSPILLEKYGYTPLLGANRNIFAPSRKKSLFSGNRIGNLVRFICLSSTSVSAKSVFTLVGGHSLQNGESIRVFADNGDLPENLDPHKVYFAITVEGDGTLGTNQIRIASSKTNAELSTPIFIKTVASTSEKFEIVSRVSDKNPNDKGHPIQFDTTNNQWFVHVINEVGTNQ